MLNGQTIIAVCGADGTGKTEISKALSKALNIPYYKDSAERDTYLRNPDDFLHQLRHSHVGRVDFLRQTGHSVIFDRSWPSEWVYAPIMGRQTDMDVLHQVDEAYAELGARIVICDKSSYDGVIDDIDPALTGQRLAQIAGRYRLFTEWTQCQSYILNVDSFNTEAEVAEILAWLSK